MEILDAAVADVQPQGTDGGGSGKRRRLLSLDLGRHGHSRQEAGGRGLHIALYAGHLSGEGHQGVTAVGIEPVQQLGTLEEGILMHDPIADEFRIRQRRDHGEHPLLLPELQVGLEAHQIVDALGGVVLPQLQHRVGLCPGSGVRQPHRLHGAKAQGIQAPSRHDLHRHAALKDPLVFKPVDLRLLGSDQGLHKVLVLLLIHGAVHIVRGAPVIAALPPGQVHIHRLSGHQGGRRVKKVEIVRPEVLPDGLRQGIGGQRTRGDDHRPLGDLGHLFGNHSNIGVGADLFRHHPGEALPVYGQAPAGLHPCGLGTRHDQAAAATQLLLEEAYGVFQPVPPEGVGADQLREIRTVVGGAHFLGLHLIELHPDPPLRQLPGSLRTGQARANDFHFHQLCSFVVFLGVFAAVFLAAVVFLAATVFLAAVVFFAAAFFTAVFLGAASGAAPAGSPGS